MAISRTSDRMEEVPRGADSLQRNYGIDLLRILSMFAVVYIHAFGEGGIGLTVAQFSSNYYCYLVLRFLSEFAVDAFGMITGYVMFYSKPRFSKLVMLWFEVLFYSVSISVLFLVFDPGMANNLRKEIYLMLLPVGTNRYWYISCYFCMYFLIPVMNAGVNFLSRDEMKKVLISLFVLISVIGNLNTSRTDAFHMNYGYSAAWLCYLYLAGAYFRKYETASRIGYVKLLAGIIACVLVTVLFKVNMDQNRWRLEYTLDWMLISNVSVTFFLLAVCMLLLFSKLHIPEKLTRVIAVISPATLGVYLIHVHPLIWKRLFSGSFKIFANSTWYIMVLQVTFWSVFIFVSSLLIDLVRIRLFKCIHLDQLATKVGNGYEALFKKKKDRQES